MGAAAGGGVVVPIRRHVRLSERGGVGLGIVSDRLGREGKGGGGTIAGVHVRLCRNGGRGIV